MKRQNKLTSRQQAEEQQQSTAPVQNQQGKGFETADELLRYDALHTPVPPNVAVRLQKSIGPASRPGWLKRFFGGSKP